MKKHVIKLSLSIFAFGITNLMYAQDVDKDVLNWYNGNGTGMQTEKAYKKLKKRETKTVIVAIIDSGIDIEHEDLKGKIWANTDEIPGNGIDDDNNGYIDDVHGWNFLGNASGENANSMRLERTRMLAELDDKYDGVDESTVSASEKEEFALYQKLSMEVEMERTQYGRAVGYFGMVSGMIDESPNMLKEIMEKDNATVAEVEEKMESLEDEIADYEKALKKEKTSEMEEKLQKSQDAYDQLAFCHQVMTGELTKEQMTELKDMYQGMIDTHHNVDFDGRSVVGDDPNDFTDVKYGNNDVEGPDALHGTHVGGIVGAIRGNELGGDGVANDVLLMSLRAVPDGDEFDKDIALAIRYAVDNGASIINMSFGKSYSPHQKEVYDAFAYADSKGVLCIHAAGNDNADVDVEPNFPTSMYSFQSKKLDHFMTIGSSTKDLKLKVKVAAPTEKDPEKMKKKKLGFLPSPFSNYGQTSVDVFAPGSEIYNSVPQSEYKELQGTSMACPMVSGVAAMLKSYFPEMSMKEIKDVILSSSTSYAETMQVKPGERTDTIDFAKLSVTGGVVNVYAAVKACLKIEKAKK
jgi:subtilisin family serine protease